MLEEGKHDEREIFTPDLHRRCHCLHRLRLLAVTTPKRMSTMPDVPTVAEAGYPGYDVNASYSVLAPAGTPAPIVTRLSAELVKIVNCPISGIVSPSSRKPSAWFRT